MLQILCREQSLQRYIAQRWRCNKRTTDTRVRIMRYVRLSMSLSTSSSLGSCSQRAGSLCHLARHIIIIMPNFMVHLQTWPLPRLGVCGKYYVYAAFSTRSSTQSTPPGYATAADCLFQLSTLFVVAVFDQLLQPILSNLATNCEPTFLHDSPSKCTCVSQ